MLELFIYFLLDGMLAHHKATLVTYLSVPIYTQREEFKKRTPWRSQAFKVVLLKLESSALSIKGLSLSQLKQMGILVTVVLKVYKKEKNNRSRNN